MGIVHTFSHPPAITPALEKRIVDYPGKQGDSYDGLQPDWDALMAQFTPQRIPDPSWKELIFVVQNRDYIKDGNIHLQGAAIDSYTVQALRRGYFTQPEPFLNTSVTSCLLTKDDRLVVGQRSGSGHYALIGGSITFKTEYTPDPVIDAFLAEARAELGSRFMYTSLGLIGITQSTEGMPGLKFVVHGQVDVTFREIMQFHKEAFQWYQDVEKLCGQQEAREAMARHPDFPPDAWEHSSLVGLFNKPADLEYAASRENILESARDSLRVYIKYRETTLTENTHPSAASPAPARASRLRYPVRYPRT